MVEMLVLALEKIWAFKKHVDIRRRGERKRMNLGQRRLVFCHSRIKVIVNKMVDCDGLAASEICRVNPKEKHGERYTGKGVEGNPRCLTSASYKREGCS